MKRRYIKVTIEAPSYDAKAIADHYIKDRKYEVISRSRSFPCRESSNVRIYLHIVYVRYSIREIQEDFNCGKEKAIKLLRELEDIVPGGLIERNKKGQGKADLIYVKNFIPTPEKLDSSGNHDPEPVGESYPEK